MCFFSGGFDKDFEADICLLYQQYYTKKYCGNLLEMEESCSERQENELQAIQAIYMDDFQDLREKVTSLKFQLTFTNFLWPIFQSGQYKTWTADCGLQTADWV